MTGLPEFNYPAFRAAERELRHVGHDVVNPIAVEAENVTGVPQAWDWYMRRTLRMLTTADAVALLPGWQSSRGAVLEEHVATALGMSCREIAHFLAA